MTQSTHIAAAQTTATSTDVVVPAGAVITIGLFTRPGLRLVAASL